MRLLAACGVFVGVLLGQSGTAHELIDEDEIVHFEVVKHGFTVGNYNWFDADADIYRGANQAMLETLFTFDHASGKLIGWLAESAEFKNDDRDVTIHLHPEARWSDGNPFTADDVAFSLLFPQSYTGEMAPHVLAVHENFRDVEVISPHKVRIGLNAPDPDFLIRHFSAYNGTSYPIVPSHIWSKVKEPTAYSSLTPIGTGAWEMVEPPDADHVAWERRPWWGTSAGLGERPHPHRLVWHPAGTLPQRPRQLASLVRDSTGDLPRRVVNGIFLATGRATSWGSAISVPARDPCGYKAFLFGTGTVLEPSETRNALFSLLDRGRLTRRVYAPALIPASSFFPTNALTHATLEHLTSQNANLPDAPNVAAAIPALQGVGCTLTRRDGGDPVERGSGTLLCPAVDAMEGDPPLAVTFDVAFEEADLAARAIAGELAGSWRAFGIDVTVHGKALSAIDDDITAKTKGLYVYPMTCAADEDALATLGRFLEDPHPLNGTPAEELADDLASLQNAPDASAAAAAYLEAVSQYDAQPLAFRTHLTPASTVFWQGWPLSEVQHGTWSQTTHQLLHALEMRE